MKPVSSSPGCHRRMTGAGGKRKDKHCVPSPARQSPTPADFPLALTAGRAGSQGSTGSDYLLESWVRERSLETGTGVRGQGHGVTRSEKYDP